MDAPAADHREGGGVDEGVVPLAVPAQSRPGVRLDGLVDVHDLRINAALETPGEPPRAAARRADSSRSIRSPSMYIHLVSATYVYLVRMAGSRQQATATGGAIRVGRVLT